MRNPCIEINLMNNPQLPDDKTICNWNSHCICVRIIMITILFNRFKTAVALEQQINSKTMSQGTTSSSSSNPLSLNTIFRQTENSVVQITSKTPTTSNSSSQSSSNVNTLGSGFVYDKQGHIVTNVHVVGGVCNISRWQ